MHIPSPCLVSNVSSVLVIASVSGVEWIVYYYFRYHLMRMYTVTNKSHEAWLGENIILGDKYKSEINYFSFSSMV